MPFYTMTEKEKKIVLSESPENDTCPRCDEKYCDDDCKEKIDEESDEKITDCD
ncbi:MAG: hypothetical protein NY202_03285 [Mollicutes bacterium UO1]